MTLRTDLVKGAVHKGTMAAAQGKNNETRATYHTRFVARPGRRAFAIAALRQS